MDYDCAERHQLIERLQDWVVFILEQAFIDNVYVYNKKKIAICFKFQDELDKYKDALMADAVTEVVNA